ncbi:type II secretion system F family protein [Halobacillus seohaensis]|uniref:Type II secretion system F family protein n=1 Tax=Halobacillus seohaensis TaxID=447421 RepID=A0ABW2ENB6_9BACI
MEGILLPTLIASFILAMLVFYWATSYITKQRKTKKRIAQIQVAEEERKKKEKSRENSLPIFQKIGRLLNNLSVANKWKQSLIIANKNISPGEFLLLRIVTMVMVTMLAYFYGLHWIMVGITGILGYLAPVFFLRKIIEKRLKRCAYQLSEALGTMSNAMRAGFSFMQAMKMISEEYTDPLGTEFKRVITDIQYGVPMEVAFEQMLERLPDKELEMTVKAMLIQRTSGGNLAVLLETIQETINGRIRVKDEVNALTSQGKLSSWVVTLLPIGLAVYLQMVNPEYFSQLYVHPLGIALIIMGASGIVIGWFMLRKIVRIEV